MRRGCAVLVAALAAAGCGGAAKTISHSTASHANTSSTPTPTAASGSAATPGDCNRLGINPTGMREGTCTHSGITYVIVDESHTLKLHTLSAKLGGIQTATSAGSQPTVAQGKFVVIAIRITNHLSLPQTFDKSATEQAALILDGTVYNEAVSADKTESASCVGLRRSIAPGSSETCRVVFDIPGASAADLGKHGRADLYVGDFGSDLAANPPPQTVGQIRLYH